MQTPSLPPVALLAGGRGTRLGGETLGHPKSLVDVAGHPFLAHQLHLLRRRGVERVVLLCGHFSDQIHAAVGDGRRFGLSVATSDDGPEPLGTGGAVRKALPLLGDRFFVLYGDSYLDVDYADVAAALKTGARGVLTICEAAAGEAGNVAIADGKITGYGKHPPPNDARYVDYGLSLFHASAFDNIPDRRPYDLGEIFLRLIARDELLPYRVAHRFLEIGSPEGLAEVRALLAGATVP